MELSDDGRGSVYFGLEDIARRETFLVEAFEIGFYWIEDSDCMQKWVSETSSH